MVQCWVEVLEVRVDPECQVLQSCLCIKVSNGWYSFKFDMSNLVVLEDLPVLGYLVDPLDPGLRVSLGYRLPRVAHSLVAGRYSPVIQRHHY